ncbi:hypothetical protein EDD15DRAFT_1261280 [Pisolithus albus]|nr:hypothetical protein EDD15DRAFT_1261280 [Pisolithus albus]
MAEIIDLTADSPKPIEISSAEEDLSTPTPTQGLPSNEKGRRHRKKKRSKRPITEQAGASASTHNSAGGTQRREEEERENAQSGTPPEVAADDSQLFYFDAVAVPVPDFINPEYARQPIDAPSEDCSQDENKLLLPSHVSLLAPSTNGADPIEVIPPPIVDSDDDYIDFLEYEDRRVRSDCRYYLFTNFSQGSRTCAVFRSRSRRGDASQTIHLQV